MTQTVRIKVERYAYPRMVHEFDVPALIVAENREMILRACLEAGEGIA